MVTLVTPVEPSRPDVRVGPSVPLAVVTVGNIVFPTTGTPVGDRPVGSVVRRYLLGGSGGPTVPLVGINGPFSVDRFGGNGAVIICGSCAWSPVALVGNYGFSGAFLVRSDGKWGSDFPARSTITRAVLLVVSEVI